MTNEEILNHVVSGMAESRAIHLETNRALAFENEKLRAALAQRDGALARENDALRAALGSAQKELLALRAAAAAPVGHGAALDEAPVAPIVGVMPEHVPEP